MAILADYHMHSNFSTDGHNSLLEMAEAAYNKGLKKICFTEHQDHGYPISEEFPEGSWMLNTDSYLYDLLKLREEYRDKLDIGFGRLSFYLCLSHLEHSPFREDEPRLFEKDVHLLPGAYGYPYVILYSLLPEVPDQYPELLEPLIVLFAADIRAPREDEIGA